MLFSSGFAAYYQEIIETFLFPLSLSSVISFATVHALVNLSELKATCQVVAFIAVKLFALFVRMKQTI
jgi:hypothetical protein